MLNIDQDNCRPRIRGLKLQDEFGLVLNFLGSCKHILPIDEGFAALKGKSACDFILVLDGEERLAIEVKSSEKSRIQISKNYLSSKDRFSKDIGIPFCFALNYGVHWSLHSIECLKEMHNKIDFAESLLTSTFEKTFGSHYYLFPQEFRSVTIYESKIESPINNKYYGGMVRQSYGIGNVECFSLAKESSEFVIGFFMDAIKCRMRETIKKEGNRTIVEHFADRPLMIADYQFYTRQIKQIVSDNGFQHDQSSYMQRILDRRHDPITKSFVEKCMLILVEKGINVTRLQRESA